MIRAWVAGHRRLVIVVLVLAALATAVSLHLAVGQGPSSEAVRSGQVAVATTPTGSAPYATPEASNRAATATLPESFARQVAGTLFDWDTTIDNRDAITAQILDVADPTGVETPGLMTDLEVYLPDDAWWARLRQYDTVQWLDVETATVPEAWTEATARGATDDLAPGTTAVTVTGTLHRAGNVAGQPETASARLVMTVFVACTDQDGCALLRLSGPGQVLDNERLH